MKDTGVIRKIDELGRIVIPKEIRRSLGIKDGETLEIFIEKQNICLQKHSLLSSLEDVAKRIIDIANDTLNLSILIMDREKVIVSSNPTYIGRKYNATLTKLLESRESYESKSLESILEKDNECNYYYIIPLIESSDVLGLLILVSQEAILESTKKVIHFISKLIINKIDIL